MEKNFIERQYGLILNPNPFLLGQKLHAMYLKLGLPCVSGIVTGDTLKNPEIRRSVAAFFYSVMESKILAEPVHFGCIGSAYYNQIAICVTQKKYDFIEIGPFVWDDVNVVVSDAITAMTVPYSDIMVCSVQESKVESTRPVTVTLKESDNAIIMPIETPTSVRPSGFNVVSRDLNNKDKKISKSTVQIVRVNIGQQIVVFVEPFENIFALGVNVYGTHKASYELELRGAITRSKKKKVKEYLYDNMYHSIPVIAVSETVMVIINYKWKGVLYSEYVKVPKYLELSQKLEKRCEILFNELICELEAFPRTRIIEHLLFALVNYIPGYKMPNPALLNQVLDIVGRNWMCTSWYEANKQIWCPYTLFIDWVEQAIDYTYDRGFVYRNVMEIPYDDPSYESGAEYFVRSGVVFEAYDTVYYQKPPRGMSYFSYIDWLERQYNISLGVDPFTYGNYTLSDGSDEDRADSNDDSKKEEKDLSVSENEDGLEDGVGRDVG